MVTGDRGRPPPGGRRRRRAAPPRPPPVPGLLRSAEPQRVSDAERTELARAPERGRQHESPRWVRQLAQARPAFREQLADRQSVRLPDPDPEAIDHGPAWPSLAPPERDAILQPPAPEMPAAPGIGREAEPEAGS